MMGSGISPPIAVGGFRRRWEGLASWATSLGETGQFVASSGDR